MPNPAADMWVMTLTNSNEGGPLNPAQFGVEIDPASTQPNFQVAAQLIAYVVATKNAFLNTGTLIDRLQFRASGTGGFIDFEFPTDTYADLVDLNPGNLVAMEGYGEVVIGASGGLAPVGTSVCVTEYTAQFGRSARGRHFLPFVNKARVDNTGQLTPESRTTIEQGYEDYILTGSEDLGSQPLRPVVQNAGHSTIKPITHVKAQGVLSNLRSRRR